MRARAGLDCRQPLLHARTIVLFHICVGRGQFVPVLAQWKCRMQPCAVQYADVYLPASVTAGLANAPSASVSPLLACILSGSCSVIVEVFCPQRSGPARTWIMTGRRRPRAPPSGQESLDEGWHVPLKL